METLNEKGLQIETINSGLLTLLINFLVKKLKVENFKDMFKATNLVIFHFFCLLSINIFDEDFKNIIIDANRKCGGKLALQNSF